MPTTQSEDPDEAVHHPRHYNQHPSNIECIELIEHLPANFANAVKYIWRCGLKATSTPLRDLESAKWYTEREIQRVDLFEIYDESYNRLRPPKTDVVWRVLAKKVISVDVNSTLGRYLDALLIEDYDSMIEVLDIAIAEPKK